MKVQNIQNTPLFFLNSPATSRLSINNFNGTVTPII